MPHLQVGRMALFSTMIDHKALFPLNELLPVSGRLNSTFLPLSNGAPIFVLFGVSQDAS
jgi:hypothetical protein